MVHHKRNPIAHLEKSLEINPTYLPALFLLCEHYLQSNEDELANVYLEKIKEIEPENPKYLFLSAKLALKKGDLAKAKEYIDHCLLNKHFDKEVLVLGLQIANTLKINKDKIYILENWLLHHEASAEKYLELAKSLDQPNHYEKASYYFQVAQELAPDNIDILIEHARFHCSAKGELSDGTVVAKRDLNKSKEILNEILSIHEDSKSAVCLLGEIYFDEGEFTDAKKLFHQCYKNNFKKDSYLLKLAKIAEKNSEFELQEKLLWEATTYKNLRPEAFAELLNSKFSQGNLSESFSIGLKTIKYYRRKIRFTKNEINKYLKLNLFIESKDLTRELNVLRSKLARVYYILSETQKSETRQNKYLDESLTYDSSNSDANYKKALLLKENASSKCLDHLKACIDKAWYHWQARWEYICLNQKKMSQDEIISFLKIILEVNPSHKEAKLKLNTLISTNP